MAKSFHFEIGLRLWISSFLCCFPLLKSKFTSLILTHTNMFNIFLNNDLRPFQVCQPYKNMYINGEIIPPRNWVMRTDFIVSLSRFYSISPNLQASY